VVSTTPRPFYPPEKIRYPLCWSLGGLQNRSGCVRKFLPPSGIRSPDRPARSQSLYRLNYPAKKYYMGLYRIHRKSWIKLWSVFPTPIQKKNLHINTCPLTLSFRGTAKPRVDPFKLMSSTHTLLTRCKTTTPA
jgi:hypothetical protein